MTLMTPIDRVLTTLQHKEADRVPFFLPLTMHGARELGLTLNEYFSKPEYIVEAQMRMWKKYQHDFLYSFFYAAVEVEAWGGSVIYTDDGPPNAADPFLRTLDQIASLEVPNVHESPSLTKVLQAIALMKEQSAGEIPIVGVVMSPFSLPVMQMGFNRYLDLMHDEPEHFEQLMRVNEAFCVAWANAQFEAGATTVGYFDPISSPTIVPRELYLQTGFPIAKRVFSQLKGPVVTLLASGRVLPIIEDIAQIGTAVVGASTMEDLAEMKKVAQQRFTIIGNLNAIEMCRWTPEEAETEVKQAIAKAGKGGGFILCDNHGEIPWQVPEQTLLAISEAVRKWGSYPLTWVESEV